MPDTLESLEFSLEGILSADYGEDAETVTRIRASILRKALGIKAGSPERETFFLTGFRHQERLAMELDR